MPEVHARLDEHDLLRLRDSARNYRDAQRTFTTAEEEVRKTIEGLWERMSAIIREASDSSPVVGPLRQKYLDLGAELGKKYGFDPSQTSIDLEYGILTTLPKD